MGIRLKKPGRGRQATSPKVTQERGDWVGSHALICTY